MTPGKLGKQKMNKFTETIKKDLQLKTNQHHSIKWWTIPFD